MIIVVWVMSRDTFYFLLTLLWVAIVAAALLATAGIFSLGSLNYWNGYSIALILLSYWLYRVARHFDRRST